MIGILSADEIARILARQRVGRLACAVDDHPYIVPITYAYDGEFFYGYGAPGRKIEVMRRQPRVCFEVDELDGESEWRSVVADGLFEEITDDDQRRTALRLLNGHGPDSRPVGRSLDAAPRLVLFRIRVTTRSGRFERRDA